MLVPVCKISEEISEVSWVVALEVGISEWTSEMDLTLASVGTLYKASGLSLEVTTEGTLDGIPTVKVSLFTGVTSEKSCLWNLEVEEISEETLDETDVRLWLIIGVTSKTWVWTSEFDEMFDVKLTGLLVWTIGGFWGVIIEETVEATPEFMGKVFISEGTGVLT